ncbi:hypothetical protein D3C76_1674070 [compost metagenome]
MEALSEVFASEAYPLPEREVYKSSGITVPLPILYAVIKPVATPVIPLLFGVVNCTNSNRIKGLNGKFEIVPDKPVCVRLPDVTLRLVANVPTT